MYLHSGEFQHSVEDLRLPGRGIDLVWARKYRSRLGPATALGPLFAGTTGQGVVVLRN